MDIHSIKPVSNNDLATTVASSPIPREQRAENRELIQAVKAVNATELLGFNRELAFFVDRETGRPVVRVVDRETKEVIRQVPAEYVMQMARHAREMEKARR
jgi:flagellar protein FlaG